MVAESVGRADQICYTISLHPLLRPLHPLPSISLFICKMSHIVIYTSLTRRFIRRRRTASQHSNQSPDAQIVYLCHVESTRPPHPCIPPFGWLRGVDGVRPSDTSPHLHQTTPRVAWKTNYHRSAVRTHPSIIRSKRLGGAWLYGVFTSIPISARSLFLFLFAARCNVPPMSTFLFSAYQYGGKTNTLLIG